MERTERLSRQAPPPLVLVDDAAAPTGRSARTSDREPELIRVCLVCGSELLDRACKLVCRCGYFLSCSDYL